MFNLFYPFLQPMFWPYMVTTAFALVVLVNGRRQPWLFGGLGGFLLGQLIARFALPIWDFVAVFWLSAVLGLALGALAYRAARPLVVLASFLGVGFLALALGDILGAGSPWQFIAAGVAGGMATAALFLWSYDRALAVNAALAAAGLIIATLAVWIVSIRVWGGWPAIVIGAIAAVVGIIYQFRDLPATEAAAPTRELPSTPARP